VGLIGEDGDGHGAGRAIRQTRSGNREILGRREHTYIPIWREGTGQEGERERAR